MKTIFFLLVFTSAIIISSCSHIEPGTPSVPDNQQDLNYSGNIPNPPVYVSDYDSSGNPLAGMGVLGIYSGYIDSTNLIGEVIPLRTNSLTDTLEVVDITNFLTLSPCTDCVKIKSISRNPDGYPVVTIGIRHPFDAGEPLKPITGRNRADLHVFNVEGIIAVESDDLIFFPSFSASISDAGLLNPDGYTDYLDPYLDDIFPTDADLHPYKLHFDDYSIGNFDPLNEMGFESVTTPPPSGNLVMAMGCDYDFKDYIFNIKEGSHVNFILAVGCTYAVSAASKNQRFKPEYRIPQHNKKAASEVWVEIASNNLIAGDITSTAELSIFVLDMNHGVEVGDALNQMAYDSSVGGIRIEVPGITSGLVSDYEAMGGNGRDPGNPLLFKATITNVAGGGQGKYHGLVKVIDNYPPGKNESPLLNGKDGIKRVDPSESPLSGLFSIAEFATYAAFEIDIISVEPQDPIAIIKTIPDPPIVSTPPTIQFDGSDSYDPDGGSITLFEWDFDWDGDPSDFSPDVSGPDAITEYTYSCLPGTYLVALRVTDDDTPAGVSEIASVQVTIEDEVTSGAWGATVNLGTEMIQGDFLYMTGQMLNMESNGLVHIITYDWDPDLYFYSVYHRTFDGTNLSPPETVSGTPQFLRMVTSAIDDNDELHVVWFTDSDPNETLQHTCTQNGNFTGAVDNLKMITTDAYHMEMMNIQSNPDGNIMVTWLIYDTDKLDVHFEYTLNEGSGFIPATQIPYFINIRNVDEPNPGYTNVSPVLVSTPDNKYHQIYYCNESDLSFERKIYDLVYNGTSWDSPRVVYDHPTTGAIMFDIAACSDYKGDIHVTGESDLNLHMGYVRYDAVSDTWMEYKEVDDNPKSFPYGAVEVDPYGFIHLIFKGNYAVDVDYGFLHYKIFCDLADETTILAIPDYVLDDTTTNSQQCHTDLMWDKNGNLLVLFQDSRDYILGNTYFKVLSYD